MYNMNNAVNSVVRVFLLQGNVVTLPLCETAQHSCGEVIVADRVDDPDSVLWQQVSLTV